MARLPDPILDSSMVEWPDETEYIKKSKSFASILAEAVRKAKSKEKKNKDGKEVEQ